MIEEPAEELAEDPSETKKERKERKEREKLEKRAMKEKSPGMSKGVETLFKNIYRVHVEVSAMSDNKANFLISVNSIILLLSTAHVKEIVTDRFLLFPAAIVILSCILSMVFAVLVARPRITGERSSDRPPHQSPNLLFFGTFTSVPKDQYVDALIGLSKDGEAIYSAMAADIYVIGLVLQKKFQRLQTAYGFLLYGMPGGILLFLIIQTILRVTGTEG